MPKSIVDIAKDKGLTPAELGARGGRAAKGKPKFKLSKNRNCTVSSCAIYPCWAAPSSATPQFNGKCALANFGQSTQNFTLDVLQNGEQGFDNQMKQILSRISFLANKENAINSFGIQSKLLKEIRDTKTALYGQRIAEDPNKLAQLEQTNLLIAQLVKAPTDKKEEILSSKYGTSNK